MTKDFNPMEFMNSGIFSMDKMKESLQGATSAEGMMGFGKKLLMALIPDPTALGAVVATATVSTILSSTIRSTLSIHSHTTYPIYRERVRPRCCRISEGVQKMRALWIRSLLPRLEAGELPGLGKIPTAFCTFWFTCLF